MTSWMPFSSHTRLLRFLVQESSYSRPPTPLLPQCPLPGILTPNREQQDVSRVPSAFLTCLPPVARPAGFHVGWFVFWPIVCTRLDAPRPRGWAQFPFGCLTLVLRDTWALPLPHRNLKPGGEPLRGARGLLLLCVRCSHPLTSTTSHLIELGLQLKKMPVWPAPCY